MNTIRRLATEIEEVLRAAHPNLRKTVITKLALAVGAVLEAQTPNMVVWRMCYHWTRNGKIYASSGCAAC